MPNNDMDGTIKIVFIGDVVGRYGRRFLHQVIPLIKKNFGPDLIIANGENAAGGLGLTKDTANEIFQSGVQVITGGNHIWDKKESQELLEQEERIIRPINYPYMVPGKGYYHFLLPNKMTVTVVNVQGRVFMEPVVDNPFIIMDNFLKGEKSKVILVDFHAEATAEKQALGFFLDGRVSAVLGTHTHVQTSDLRILELGTAFQSDVGMTGSLSSVIGMKKEPILKKMVTGINHRFEVESKDMILDMSIIDIDLVTGKAKAVKAICFHESDLQSQAAF